MERCQDRDCLNETEQKEGWEDRRGVVFAFMLPGWKTWTFSVKSSVLLDGLFLLFFKNTFFSAVGLVSTMYA